MNLRFRHIRRWGPFQASINKTGFGFSFGIRGFRIGRSQDGKKYISLGFNGTGLYWIKYF